MSEGVHEPIVFGMCRDHVDFRALAKSMGLPFMPRSIASMNAAVAKLAQTSSAPPLRRQVQSAKLATPKGSTTTMPAATVPTSPNGTYRHLTEPGAEGYSAPHHLNSMVRGIQGNDAYLQVYNAQMALQSAMGKLTGNRCRHADSHLTRNCLTPLNIATSNDAAKGGYLAPDEMAKLIIAKWGPVSVARRAATWQPMTSGTLKVPKEVSGPTVRYGTQGEALTPSDFTFGSVNFSADKRSILWRISNELKGDQLFSAVDNFTTRAAYSFAKQQDAELVLGDGTSNYGGEQGLLASLGSAGIVTAATGHDTWPELDLDDFGAVMAKPSGDFLNGGESWICSPQFYYIAMLPAAGGAAQGFDALGRPMFLGKPVEFTNAMPTTSAAATVCCLFGNFAEAVMIGDRSIMFSISDQVPGAFENDLTYLRATARYDVNVHEGGNASTAGAYAGLATAAS
jgi:HK97 family phage major capsid protein